MTLIFYKNGICSIENIYIQSIICNSSQYILCIKLNKLLKITIQYNKSIKIIIRILKIFHCKQNKAKQRFEKTEKTNERNMKTTKKYRIAQTDTQPLI